MDVSDIPITWRSLLGVIQRHRPEAVIAGGCLRDRDNDRPEKDIDIFVAGVSQDDLYGLHRRLQKGDFEVADLDPDKFYPVGEANVVIGVIEMTSDATSLPIQVIMLRHLPDPCGGLSEKQSFTDFVMERMDYGICQLVFDGARLHEGPDYRSDKDAQRFAMRHERTGCELASSVHRYARLSQRYVGWRWAPYDPFLASPSSHVRSGVLDAADIF